MSHSTEQTGRPRRWRHTATRSLRSCGRRNGVHRRRGPRQPRHLANAAAGLAVSRGRRRQHMGATAVAVYFRAGHDHHRRAAPRRDSTKSPVHSTTQLCLSRPSLRGRRGVGLASRRRHVGPIVGRMSGRDRTGIPLLSGRDYRPDCSRTRNGPKNDAVAIARCRSVTPNHGFGGDASDTWITLPPYPDAQIPDSARWLA